MKSMKLMALSVLMLTIFACDSNSSNVLIAYVYQHEYQGSEGNDFDYDGIVMGDPLPFIESVTANNITGVDELYVSENSFDFDFTNDATFGDGDITIKTSEGTITGKVEQPTVYDSVKASTTDYYIPLNTALTVTTYGGKMDFKYIYAEFEYYDGESWNYMEIDSAFEGDTFTFPASMLNTESYLYIYGIDCANGPIVKAGSSGNMSGDGKGFMWSIITDDNFYMSFAIGIEAGSNVKKTSAHIQERRTREDRKRRFYEKAAKVLNEPTM